MPSQHQLAGPAIAGLLLMVVAAACKFLGPDLNISVDNTGGPEDVTVTVDSSGLGMTDGDDVVIHVGEGSAWSVPLGSTWEVKINGKHVIGSGDGSDLALPSPGRGHDVNLCIEVARDGAVQLDDGCWVSETKQPGSSG